MNDRHRPCNHDAERSGATVAHDAPPPGDGGSELIGGRLRQLFRRTLKTGELNPLVYIVQRYRLEHDS